MNKTKDDLFQSLLAPYLSYLSCEQIEEVYHAYTIGADAHKAQTRKSGEPYISHPLEVARIITEIKLDHQSIIAAILHDVLEDTDVTKAGIIAEFGKEVAEIVDGVTKLDKIHFRSKEEAQAESFRKMIMAMATDIRVILIKLADRLHNMRTLGSLALHKKKRIARETQEIYAPLARRLGMNNIAIELDDLCFKNLYPWRSCILINALDKQLHIKDGWLLKAIEALKKRLQEHAISAEIIMREKSIYSLYQKMYSKPFKNIYDIYAIRIIVDSIDSCYRVLGIAHNLYKPIPNTFKDYIAIPKANGYQSLHSVLVIGTRGVKTELQIRTQDMHAFAESGVASHWIYKNPEYSLNKALNVHTDWFKHLLEIQNQTRDSFEFLEHVKTDLFPDEVYVFTPSNKIITLPKGATVIDFAYHVHTDVGNHCRAAKIDEQYVTLSTLLETGQMVEIITDSQCHPKAHWLNFVVTSKARSNIRHFFKNLKHSEAQNIGQTMLERALATSDYSLEQLSDAQKSYVIQLYKMQNFEEILIEIGLGKISAPLLAQQLLNNNITISTSTPIVQAQGVNIHFPRCCYAIPHDEIKGYLSGDKGLMIHRKECRNIKELEKDYPEKIIALSWETTIVGEFCVEIQVDVKNQRGVLAEVAAIIAKFESNIDQLSLTDHGGVLTAMRFTISVRNRTHLADIIKNIKKIESVIKVFRIKTT